LDFYHNLVKETQSLALLSFALANAVILQPHIGLIGSLKTTMPLRVLGRLQHSLKDKQI